ncbi:MAG: hypothetical protein QOE93_2068, partial [Actinomycetota bacterium]|nr:hypothetical protein [Actinomycetota bacterium]
MRARLALAAAVVDDVRRSEDVVAALVVGSTALRRCSARADLDVVVVTASTPGNERFTSDTIDGVKVEIERLSRREALATTAGGGWIWELRQASRLGTGVPVFDPDGFAAVLAHRAAAMMPWPDRVEDTLRDVYVALVDLAGREDAGRRADGLRGVLDNLALLTLLEHPRRYQKAKWALADLLHAGHDVLVDTILAAYGIEEADAAAVIGAREIIGQVYALTGLPSHEAILALGYAPELAEASYVSRTLDDAEDLEASGRLVEAQYVAKFATRLAAGLISPPDAEGGVVDVLAERGGDDLARRYLALFPSAAE